MTPEHLARFAEQRTSVEVKKLLRYANFIPQIRGYTQEYVDEYWPGHTFGSLVEVLKAAEVLTFVSGLGAVFTPSGKVSDANDLREFRQFHFTNVQEWAVEWPDGSWTSSPTNEPREPCPQ